AGVRHSHASLRSGVRRTVALGHRRIAGLSLPRRRGVSLPRGALRTVLAAGPDAPGRVDLERAVRSTLAGVRGVPRRADHAQSAGTRRPETRLARAATLVCEAGRRKTPHALPGTG